MTSGDGPICKIWTHSRIAGAERPSIPPLARRAQVLSERQRAINRSVLRLLAYPQRGCRRRLTTWKKNGRCVAPARVRRANLYSLQVFTRWRSLKPCARPGKRSILREAPRADRAKCGVSPHLQKMVAGVGRPGPRVAPPAGADYWEKKGPGTILFPSSTRLPGVSTFCLLMLANPPLDERQST